MSFPLNVYFVAVMSAFVTAALSLPLWRRWSLRIGLVDDPGHRKIHAEPIPLAGGFAVITGLLLPVLLGSLAIWLKTHDIDVRDALAVRHAYSDATSRAALLDSESEYACRTA